VPASGTFPGPKVRTRGVRTGGGSQKCAMNLFYPHGNRVLQSPMHALAAEQGDAEAEERAGLRPWRMGAVGCMAAKAPGRARRKGSNGRDGLASCMATTRRKRKPHGQRRVAQCERFNCSCGKQSRSDVIPLLSFHMQTNGGCADVTWPPGEGAGAATHYRRGLIRLVK